jgi:Acetyltransferases
LALPAEASAVAALQRRSWIADYPTELSDELLAAADLEAMTQSWQTAILRPPLAQFRVLVAVGAERIVGFAAIGPSDDPDATAGADALVAEFTIDPQARHNGHGSRLLNAVADTLRADGFERATWWVRSTDDALREFLGSAGWAPDGAHTEVATSAEGQHLKLVRLHTGLA